MRGTGVTEAMTVMLRAEYELYVSGFKGCWTSLSLSSLLLLSLSSSHCYLSVSGECASSLQTFESPVQFHNADVGRCVAAQLFSPASTDATAPPPTTTDVPTFTVELTHPEPSWTTTTRPIGPTQVTLSTLLQLVCFHLLLDIVACMQATAYDLLQHPREISWNSPRVGSGIVRIDPLRFFWFSVLFHCFIMCLSCPRALRDIFHTSTARCKLFVLKMPLNTQ